jgi:hypothetical protein
LDTWTERACRQRRKADRTAQRPIAVESADQLADSAALPELGSHGQVTKLGWEQSSKMVCMSLLTKKEDQEPMDGPRGKHVSMGSQGDVR